MAINLSPTQFRDTKSRTWDLRLNPLLVKHTKEITGVHLTDLGQDPFLRLETDPLLICDVLWCLCEDQAKSAGVTAEDFYQGLEGQQIAAAAEALGEAICFFSHPAMQSSVRGSLKRTRELRQKAMIQGLAKLEDTATEQRILTALAQETDRAISRAIKSSASGSSGAETSAG